MHNRYYNNQEEHTKHCDGKEFVVETGEKIGVELERNNELSIVHFYDSDPKAHLKEAYCDECLATVNLNGMFLIP